MIQRNSFEMATHDFVMKWPTSWEREIHLERMALREEGDKLVSSLKKLSSVLEEFNAILR